MEEKEQELELKPGEIVPGVRRRETLAPHTIEVLKQTMHRIEKNWLHVAENTYKNLVRTVPEVAHMFSLEFRDGSGMQGLSVPGDSSPKTPMGYGPPIRSADGTQKRYDIKGQARVVSEVLFRFLMCLDDIETFELQQDTIAAKHVARAVKPMQYHVWGLSFLAAVESELDELATPSVMDAWTDAYGYLATLMITRQEEMASAVEHKPGGWRGFRDFSVMSITELPHGAISVCFAPVDGKPILLQKPGQYVCIQIDTPQYGIMHRNYPVQGMPRADLYEIHLTPVYSYRGQTLSNQALLDQLTVGTVVKLSPPVGGFLHSGPTGGYH